MRTITKLVLATLVMAGIFLSCKQTAPAEETATVTEEAAPADSEKSNPISSSAAVENPKDNRRFIRTADIKFKVKNVPKSTDAIETATTKFGGFVTYTNLQSSVSSRETTKISQDSTLETTRYSVENNITIRVPNTQLDTVIKTIAKQIDFLDFRVIKADDVSLQLLANQLAQQRSGTHQSRLEKAIDNKGKRLPNIVDAEENLAAKKEQSDTKKIENLSLQDQISFSTLTLAIYQRETIRQEMVANEDDIDAYRPHLGIQILDGLKSGWFMLEAIIAFIVQLWGLLLIGSALFFVYKRYSKK